LRDLVQSESDFMLAELNFARIEESFKGLKPHSIIFYYF